MHLRGYNTCLLGTCCRQTEALQPSTGVSTSRLEKYAVSQIQRSPHVHSKVNSCGQLRDCVDYNNVVRTQWLRLSLIGEEAEGTRLQLSTKIEKKNRPMSGCAVC
jgi:hypothetical protein